MLANSFCDFNGKQTLTKKKQNKKYLLYTNHGEKVVTSEMSPMTILDVIVFDGNKQLIFYVDHRNRVSFVLSKKHPVLTPEKVADKIEKTPMFRNFIFMMFSSLFIFGVLRFRGYGFHQIRLSLGYKKDLNYKIKFLFPEKLRNSLKMRTNKLSLLFHFYWVRIPLKDLVNHYIETSDINIPMYIEIKTNPFNYYYNLKEKTNHVYNKDHYIFNTRSLRVRGTDLELFVRKSVTGQYVFVVSSILSKMIPLKEKIAYICSLFNSNKEIYDVYFEKFAQGASESGFELFKFSIKENPNSIYILDKNNENYQELKQQYPKNLFAKNSIASFYKIFKARSFISSDLVSHLQRRLYDNDSLFKKKVLSCNNKVFLQHGPSLATDIFERGYFNRKVPIAPDYLIVNSEYERNLFLKRTSYKKEQLILTGLPNLDLYSAVRNKPKKEITFLLTWRPWDLTGHIEKGSYIHRYQQFIDMIESDPFYAKKKVNIIFHPKAREILKEQFNELYKKFEPLLFNGDIKDALLNSKVLISDYSSVTFMAFAGGSNVLFYWEDKERAELEYGSPNILQKDIAFGDIVLNFDEMNSAIKRNFKIPQPLYHINNFDKLIECKHGENTLNTYLNINRILQGEKTDNMSTHKQVGTIA